MMKKLISILVCAVMCLSLCACGGSSSGKEGGFKVAIVQQLDHSSLDEIRSALEARLQESASQQGLDIQVKSFNGQNDYTTLNQIGTQIMADGYDIIVPIASLAAQCMVTAADGSDVPVVYSAVSDPEAAELTGIPKVTGTSDALDTKFIIDMILAADPDVKTVGLLYSKSETNSATPIAQAKEYLSSKGIAFQEATGNTADEVLSATASLVGRVDAVFTPTDNTIMAAASAVSEQLTQAGIPFYTGADSFVREGSFATCGVNYSQLGAATADMVLEILQGAEPGEYKKMEGGIITVNTETAKALGIDYSVFESLGAQVVEVQTGEA